MIDDDSPFFEIDGKEHCDYESALVTLLQDEIVFANERDLVFEGRPAGRTVVLFVLCNDLFAWGCADSEDLPLSEVGPLYKAHRDDPEWGVTRWCCRQRGVQPQAPIRKMMKDAGVWDDDMASLATNPDAIHRNSA